MDQNNTGANQGNEDTRAAEAHTQNAHDNLEALRDQNRRTEATAGDSANHPVGQQDFVSNNSGTVTSNATGGGVGSGNGMNATGGGTGTASEDNTQAAANVANAQDNRDALAEQNRRTEETTPDAVRDPIRQPDNQR
jgi:hypothetical protein